MSNSLPYKNLLFLAAMDEEEAALLEALKPRAGRRLPLHEKLGLTALTFDWEGGSLSVARTGVGGVNAALALAFFERAHPVDAAVLLGVGGAVHEGLEIGQAVVATHVLQHDSFSSLDFGHPRKRPGSIVLTEEDARKAQPLFPTDGRLNTWLRASYAAKAGELGPAFRLHEGVLLSGGEFVGTVERKRAIAALHGQALLVDMEGAGVAQVATRLGIPFAVAKTVADRLAPEGAIEQDFRRCLTSAAANAAAILKASRL